MIYGKVDGGAFHQLVVIHVAAVCTKKTGAVRLRLGRSDADAAKHRFQRNAIALELIRGFAQLREAALAVKCPGAVKVRDVLLLGEIAGIKRGRRHTLTALGGVAR